MPSGKGFSVVMLAESEKQREQIAQVLQRSCRDFIIVCGIDAIVRRALERPISVLIFGLSTIEKSEVAYFKILKTNPEADKNINSTLLLCKKDEIKHSFQLCRKGLFDDYFVSEPLYDPYHLIIRFRNLKSIIQDNKTSEINSASITSICDSLEEVSRADLQIESISSDSLKRLSETITTAMKSLEEMVANANSLNKCPGDVVAKESYDVIENPIISNVKDSFNEVREITRSLADLAKEQRVAISNKNESINARSKKIIVVEDNDELRENLIYLLRENNCDVKSFSYGSDFSEMAENLIADIVMLDLTLPDIPSFHIIEKIKNTSSLSGSKIFVMAQSGDNDKVELASSMGIDEVILKPIDEHILKFKLSNY